MSNVVAGWLTDMGGYGLAYLVHGGVAVLAVAVFLIGRDGIAPAQKNDMDAAASR